jgi:phage FluMu gp28-like protein
MDEDALHRHLVDKVCNGSSDRYYDLLETDAEIDLREVYDPQRARRQIDAGRQLFAGVDVGRHNDRTVISVVERVGNVYLLRALLRLQEMRLPDQQERLDQILTIPGVRSVKIDMTGLGLGLFEYTQKKFPTKVQGINFASTIRPPSSGTQSSALSSQNSSVRITEFLATRLLQTFEDRAIQIPIDTVLRDDLRKPERFISPTGRVSIAATRNEAGHADHFWSLALAINAAQTPIEKPFEYYSWLPKCRQRIARI